MDIGVREVMGGATQVQAEHLGTGSLLWQWDVNPLFKPREPSTRLDLRADGGGINAGAQRGPPELASFRALLIMQTWRSLRKNGARLHPRLLAAR